MKKNLILLSLFIALLSFYMTSNASVIMPPECYMDVEIQGIAKTQKPKKNAVWGIVKTSKATNFWPNSLCKTFKNKTLKITAKIDLRNISHMKFGLFKGSSMGENGPVPFFHWTVKNLTTNNNTTLSNNFPWLNVEIIETTQKKD